MKQMTMIAGIALAGLTLLAAPVSAADAGEFKTQKEKVSYGFGVDLARNLTRTGVDVDPDILIKGFQDELSGRKLLMSEDALRAAMSEHYAEMMRRRDQAMQMVAEQNRKIGEAFLAENKTRKGVLTLPSGLQYRVLTAGTGRKATDADTVVCHYRGTLVNGTEFDSSHRTGQPATIRVADVIPGWQEALKLMPEGSKWEIFIPPDLAYGDQKSLRNIGPNSTLIFELELISIK